MRIINETNLAEVTAQEVFDFVTSCLLRQGRKSVNEIGMCKYRSPEGLKCAAGWLLSDEIYAPDLEYKNWYDIVDVLGLTRKHCELINECQIIHDSYEPEDWKEQFNKLAERFSLNPIHD